MNANLYTMARLKYKVRHENFLFGLKILFSFCWDEDGGGGGGGVGWNYGFRGKKFKRTPNRLIVSIPGIRRLSNKAVMIP